VNSWLEDELYQQYLYDRQTVDPTWKQVFESNGHTAEGNGSAVATAEPPMGAVTQAPQGPQAPHSSSQMVPVSPGDQLVPLRGAAHRGKHDGQSGDAGRHQPACDAGEGD
jgi:2-oxoglutarate dehydrogenase complex dehydrogenase (E1) component-like enzyme